MVNASSQNDELELCQATPFTKRDGDDEIMIYDILYMMYGMVWYDITESQIRYDDMI